MSKQKQSVPARNKAEWTGKISVSGTQGSIQMMDLSSQGNRNHYFNLNNTFKSFNTLSQFLFLPSSYESDAEGAQMMDQWPWRIADLHLDPGLLFLPFYEWKSPNVHHLPPGLMSIIYCHGEDSGHQLCKKKATQHTSRATAYLFILIWFSSFRDNKDLLA